MKPTRAKLHPARGVALLTALLITAIVTVVAVGMASRQQLDIRRAGNVLDGDQAYLYALGMESWARGALGNDLRDPRTSQSDNLNEGWATGLPPIEVEGGGKVSGRIEDLQGRFNLNNLAVSNPLTQPANQPTTPTPGDQADPGKRKNRRAQQTQTSAAKEKAIFLRLLVLSGAKSDEAAALADAVADWIDQDPEMNGPNGAEDVEYLKLSPPYRTANGPFASPSELMLIRGFTPEIYAKLAPLVCALPAGTSNNTTTKINVNTAPPPVLAALFENPAQAEALLSAREFKPFTNTNELTAALRPPGGGAGAGAPPGLAELDVRSNYFLASSYAQIGRGQITLYSLLRRTAPPGAAPGAQPQGKIEVNVLMRGQGTY